MPSRDEKKRDEARTENVNRLDRVITRLPVVNEWMPEEGAYSRTDFYTTGTDTRGHDQMAPRFKVHPMINAQVAQLVQSGLFPALRSAADFWRDAGVHRLRDLWEMTTDVEVRKALQGAINQVVTMSDLRILIQAGKDAEEMLRLIDQLMTASHLYDRKQLKIRLEHYLERAEEFDEPLKTKMVAKINEHLERL